MMELGVGFVLVSGERVRSPFDDLMKALAVVCDKEWIPSFDDRQVVRTSEIALIRFEYYAEPRNQTAPYAPCPSCDPGSSECLFPRECARTEECQLAVRETL